MAQAQRQEWEEFIQLSRLAALFQERGKNNLDEKTDYVVIYPSR
ncbi:hypothetical protein SJR96_04560 [Aeromonas caviae]|nr:hypothetical protein [Aeromonas caviae]